MGVQPIGKLYIQGIRRLDRHSRRVKFNIKYLPSSITIHSEQFTQTQCKATDCLSGRYGGNVLDFDSGGKTFENRSGYRQSCLRFPFLSWSSIAETTIVEADYFIWQLQVATSCWVLYHTNVAHSAELPYGRAVDYRQVVTNDNCQIK